MMKGFEKNFIASMIQVNVPRAEKFIVTVALVVEEVGVFGRELAKRARWDPQPHDLSMAEGTIV